MRVALADDTALYRKILSMAVEKIPSAELVGVAVDGVAAVEVVKNKSVDLFLLDVCMPRMDGVEALRKIHELSPGTAVVMFSGVTSADAETTVEALEIGALEFIPKPKTNSLDESMSLLAQELNRVVRLLKIRQIHKRISTSPGARTPERPPAGSAEVRSSVTPRAAASVGSGRVGVMRRFVNFDANRSLIVIGVSTGGPNALNQLMCMLPKRLGCPVLIVQHMPPFFTASLASFLSKKSGLDVVEATHGERMQADRIYIAPGGKHMEIRKRTDAMGGYEITTSEAPPVNSCRPSVDVLFQSVASEFSGSILSIILTGMGEDGCKGVTALRRSPSTYTIAQNEESCVVYGMPRAIVERGLADEVLPLDQIAGRISELVLKRKVS